MKNKSEIDKFKFIVSRTSASTYPGSSSHAVYDQVRDDRQPSAKCGITDKEENEARKGQTEASKCHHIWLAKFV